MDNIKFIYLDSIDNNKKEHLGYNEELGVIKVYGKLDAMTGNVITLNGETFKTPQYILVTNITDIIIDSTQTDCEDLVIDDGIIEYQKRCTRFFLNQGVRQDMLRQKVLAMLPAYLDNIEPHLNKTVQMKSYISRLGYSI